MTATPRLCLIRSEPPPPRRLEVSISITDRRMPYGRSRVFRLRPELLEQLLATAERLERLA